jgi:Domain of unknown function (DUF6933)/Domain of unknown function (DUF6429)
MVQVGYASTKNSSGAKAGRLRASAAEPWVLAGREEIVSAVSLPDDLDHERMAEIALALLSLTNHGHGRVWKSLDWELMNLLHEKGWIEDPKSKAKSVQITDAGVRISKTFLRKHFGKTLKKGTLVLLQGQKENNASTESNTPSRTVVVRCTSELARALPFEIVDESHVHATEINQWHARIVKTGRMKTLLFTNSETLYSFVIIGARMQTLLGIDDIFLESVAENLTSDGLIQTDSISDYAHGRDVVFARSNNRRVLGSMNDLAKAVKAVITDDGRPGLVSDRSVTQGLNLTPMGMLNYESPLESMAKCKRKL